MYRPVVLAVAALLVATAAAPVGALSMGDGSGGPPAVGDGVGRQVPGASPPAAWGQESPATPGENESARNASAGTGTGAPDIAPGEAFAGAVGVQRSEIDGEVETRAYGLALAGAAGNASRAALVADRVGDVEDRLAALRDRRRELTAARENGSISPGRYRAEMAQVASRTRTLERLANESEAVARGLPAAVRDRQRLDVSAIRALESEARNLTGPEAAAIARSIAGPPFDATVRGGPPTGAGPPGAQRNDTPPGAASAGPDNRSAADRGGDRGASGQDGPTGSGSPGAVNHGSPGTGATDRGPETTAPTETETRSGHDAVSAPIARSRG